MSRVANLNTGYLVQQWAEVSMRDQSSSELNSSSWSLEVGDGSLDRPTAVKAGKRPAFLFFFLFFFFSEWKPLVNDLHLSRRVAFLICAR